LATRNQTCNQGVRPITAVLSHSGWQVGGCALGDLAQEFGTPLYVMDRATIESACREFLDGLKRHYPGPSEVLYASKALCTAGIARLVHQQGLATEVVSGGELATALRAGVPGPRIHFQGNAKTRAELAYGLDAGVGRFLIDNFDELIALESLAADRKKTADVLLRVAPGIEAHTHEFIHTGQADSKFGLYLPAELDAAVARLKDSNFLRFCGVQAHVGSQIFDVQPFVAAAELGLDLAVHIRDTFGLEVAELDVGGGLGIAYVEGDDPPSIDEAMAALGRAVVQGARNRGLELPKLMVEPGRAIVGTSGCTIYEIATVKRHESGRQYLLVDGGMADNPRPITYGAEYSCDPVKPAEGVSEAWRIAGKACEEGDVLIGEAYLPPVKAGDRLVVWTTGAYCFAMSSNYNRLPRPAMVLVSDGKAELLRARETYDDLMALDRLPG
jgi:diaminopimelate decarboxylase